MLRQIPGVIIRKVNEEFDRLGIRGFAIRQDIIRKLMRNLSRFERILHQTRVCWAPGKTKKQEK